MKHIRKFESPLYEKEEDINRNILIIRQVKELLTDVFQEIPDWDVSVWGKNLELEIHFGAVPLEEFVEYTKEIQKLKDIFKVRKVRISLDTESFGKNPHMAVVFWNIDESEYFKDIFEGSKMGLL